MKHHVRSVGGALGPEDVVLRDEKSGTLSKDPAFFVEWSVNIAMT